MKKLVVAAVFVLVYAGLAFTQTQTPPPAAAKADVAQTVKQLEHDWIDAYKTGDADELATILADDWRSIEPDGSRETKQSALAELKSGASKIDSYEFGPMDVKVLGRVAVVQGSDTEKSTTKGKDTSGKYVWTDVFVNRDGKWQAVRSQSAMAK
jgi:uncharacterized protein (TIGR02246 family)